MKDLWLTYKDENGGEKRVAVDADLWTVGRHSENSITITDSRLSREHLRIEKEAGDFVVSDPGSSNGTTLNGADLSDTAVLKDGDVLNLGGGIEIKVEIIDPDAAADNSPPMPDADVPPSPAANIAPPQSAVPPGSGSSIPLSFFIIAPVLGIIVLVLIAGMIFLISRDNKTLDPSGDDDFVYSSNDADDTDPPPKNSDSDLPVKSPTPVVSGSTANSGTSPDTRADVNVQTATPGQNLTDTGKIEQNGAAFLRRIAQNDPKAFLTGEQARRIDAKVKQLGKSALADNINSARKNAAQIRSLAAAKNLKPQFLAVAAIAKLGNSRGDVVQTATSIAEVYDKLGTQIGSEFADDSLLMVAAYDQGAAGETMKLRNMLQELSNKSSESARAIRTIWFLEKNGKITSGEFNNALNFLAVGTITQNPKDFGVNAEALNL
ncbi:MAG: FHA domain-containing protein [Saprospiraceae bacterium]|nr:FHA domain-containing protein [Pyrinomonadaceae bacterium]